MNRTFWAGVALQVVSIVAILATSNPWTLVSGTVGVLLLTVAMYQGARGRRTWADGAAVVIALGAIIGVFVQLSLAVSGGAVVLTALLLTNLVMAAICAAFLTHWLLSITQSREESATSAPSQLSRPLPKM